MPAQLWFRRCQPLACLAFFLFFPMRPTLLHAYCPVPEIKANGEFFKASHVFTGKAISQRYVDDKGNVEGGWYYRITVNKTFRGPVGKEFTVFTGDDSNRFPLEVGKEYLLFAYASHRRLVIDSCSNSAAISEAATSLRLLQDLLDGKLKSEIEGWVIGETGGVDTSGVVVTLRGSSKNYSAVTDADGKFRLSVPPGRYRVDFASGDYYLNVDDDFWYTPRGFSIHPGECASLQLASARHKTAP